MVRVGVVATKEGHLHSATWRSNVWILSITLHVSNTVHYSVREVR